MALLRQGTLCALLRVKGLDEVVASTFSGSARLLFYQRVPAPCAGQKHNGQGSWG